MKPWGREIFLPKFRPIKWTAARLILLGTSAAVFIDSLIIPASRNVDPGASGAGILFLILGFRAAAKTEPDGVVLIAGVCLAVLTSLFNHEVLKLRGWFGVPIVLILLTIVLLWGRDWHTRSEPQKN